MSTFFARRGGPRRPIQPTLPRVGHFYLGANARKMLCLNETALAFVKEGIPFSPRDLAKQPLLTPDGHVVDSNEMPLFRALREEEAVQAVFLLERPKRAVEVLVWHVSPVRREGKGVSGVFGTLTLLAPEPDWEELAGLAHDLCSPLQAVRNLIPVIQAGTQFGPAAEALERLKAVTTRALNLSRDLIEFSRAPTVGAPRPNRGWISLTPLLDKLSAEQNPTAVKKGIRLDTDLQATTGVEAHTDSDRMARLFTNLLVNAIRYTPSGRVLLSAEWRKSDLVVSVEDTGQGIATDDPESIFQPFHRGKAGASDSDSGGSGLGLAVVDRLVSDLELTLEVYSEHGQGSRFDLILPAVQLRREAT